VTVSVHDKVTAREGRGKVNDGQHTFEERRWCLGH
jgi:hypothetical protein